MPKNRAIENPLHMQVSIRGPHVSALTPKLSRALVEAMLDGHPHEHFEVRIKIWRGGKELDWQDDNPRAENLKQLIRRSLQSGALRIGTVGSK